MKTKYTPFDIVLLIGILLLALLVAFLPNLLQKEAETLRITSENGEEFYTLGQAKTVEIASHGHKLTVQIESDGVYVAKSDCGDKICKNSGKIHKGGDVIICAPAGVRIELLSGKEEADYVVG